MQKEKKMISEFLDGLNLIINGLIFLLNLIIAGLNLYINLFWISIPLTIYVVIEFNRCAKGQPFIFVELYEKVMDWRERQ
jgi:hypothetical protein